MNSCFQANILAVAAVSPRSNNLDRSLGPWPEVWALSLSPPDISTRRLTPGEHLAAFGVWRESIGGEALSSHQYLYLRQATPRLPLKAFRGVRAISQFD